MTEPMVLARLLQVAQLKGTETALVVGAGDRAKIEDQLKKLSIGAVEVRDYEGNPVSAKAAGAQ